MLDNMALLSLAARRYFPDAQQGLSERNPEAFEHMLITTLRRMAERGYKFTTAAQIDTLRAYVDGYGILISGAVGIGKTLFFRRLSPDIVILSMGDIVGMSQDELFGVVNGCKDSELVLDDIGLGGSIARDFGREYDALLAVLNWREKSKARTHFTTNLTNDALVANFDARAVDRIYGLAKCFSWRDMPSMREPKIYGGV